MAHAAPSEPVEIAPPPAYFKEALEDAERLLKYAAEIGVEDIDDETRSAVLHARAVFPQAWTEEVADNLLVALSRLAYRLKPVSAASLKAYQSADRHTMRWYLTWAIILSLLIIPASIATFITSNISESIGADITTANALAVKLNTELNLQARPDLGEKDKLSDLQEYASTVRSIFARAEKLNWFLFLSHVTVPPQLQGPENPGAVSKADTGQKDKAEQEYKIAEYKKSIFELPVPPEDLPAARDKMTRTYQDVRYFAQIVRSDISTWYGALNSCILPILYALLGTCAYLLRSFEDQMNSRSFIPSTANSARFLIAAIGGTVIGLFGNFTQQASVSPLAVAFLVGYAVEVFFSFLESLIKSFTRSAPAPQPAVKAAARKS